MALYEPIPFSKEAEQIIVPDTDSGDGSITGRITMQSLPFEIYRDTAGFYTLVPTNSGTRRANPTDWIMLESDVIPAVPAVPEVPGTNAIGVFLVAVNAAGDGVVGFDYNGIVYAVSPTAADTPAVTAQALVDLVNLGGQMTAVLNADTVELTANIEGVSQNITLIDVTTDTTQTGTPSGMSGGTDFVPAVPEIPEQPAVFSVWTDTQFNELFQLV